MWRSLERILLGEAKKDDVPCRFCGKKNGPGHLFWECTFPLFLHVRELSEFASLTSLCSGMAGCLVLAAVMGGVLGLLLLVSWPVWNKNVAWVLIRWIALVIGLRLIIEMLTILLW